MAALVSASSVSDTDALHSFLFRDRKPPEHRWTGNRYLNVPLAGAVVTVRSADLQGNGRRDRGQGKIPDPGPSGR